MNAFNRRDFDTIKKMIGEISPSYLKKQFYKKNAKLEMVKQWNEENIEYIIRENEIEIIFSSTYENWKVYPIGIVKKGLYFHSNKMNLSVEFSVIKGDNGLWKIY